MMAARDLSEAEAAMVAAFGLDRPGTSAEQPGMAPLADVNADRVQVDRFVGSTPQTGVQGNISSRALSLPDRTELIEAAKTAWGNQWIERHGEEFFVPPVSDNGATIQCITSTVDAVLAALSTQPAAGEVEWRKSFAAELRAAVGAVVKPSAGAASVFEFSPKGDSMEFWSYGNATAYSGAVIEVLRMLDPDMEFERATTYHGGRDKPRTLDEAMAELREES